MVSRILIFFIFIFFTTSSSYARLGETEQESSKRYGNPVKNTADTVLPILKNTVNRTYDYQGWRTRSAFINGHAVRIAYSKLTKPKTTLFINSDETDAILSAEAHGGKWEKGKRKFALSLSGLAKNLALGNKIWWTHSKGLKAHMKIGNLVLFVESPEASIWEQAIVNEEKVKEKESIPQF